MAKVTLASGLLTAEVPGEAVNAWWRRVHDPHGWPAIPGTEYAILSRSEAGEHWTVASVYQNGPAVVSRGFALADGKPEWVDGARFAVWVPSR